MEINLKGGSGKTSGRRWHLKHLGLQARLFRQRGWMTSEFRELVSVRVEPLVEVSSESHPGDVYPLDGGFSPIR